MATENSTKEILKTVIEQLNSKHSKEVLAYAQMLLEMQKSDESLLNKIAPKQTDNTVN